MNHAGYQEVFPTHAPVPTHRESCMLCDNPFPFGCASCTADMAQAMNATFDGPSPVPPGIPGDAGFPPGLPYERQGNDNPKPKLFVGSGEDCIYPWLKELDAK